MAKTSARKSAKKTEKIGKWSIEQKIDKLKKRRKIGKLTKKFANS